MKSVTGFDVVHGEIGSAGSVCPQGKPLKKRPPQSKKEIVKRNKRWAIKGVKVDSNLRQANGASQDERMEAMQS